MPKYHGRYSVRRHTIRFDIETTDDLEEMAAIKNFCSSCLLCCDIDVSRKYNVGVTFLGKWSFVTMFPCSTLRDDCGFHYFICEFTQKSMDSDFEIHGFNQNLQNSKNIYQFQACHQIWPF